MAKRKKARKTKKAKKKTPREHLIDLLNKPNQTLEDLCDGLDEPPKVVRTLLVELERMGVKVAEDHGIYGIVAEERLGPQDLEHEQKLPAGLHRIGLLADTHLGSHYQQLTYLKEYYERAVDLGVKRFYHAGDLFAGDGTVYRGQINEVFMTGLDHSVEYLTEVYPRYKGVETFFITGNHDLSWWKNGGVDIGYAVERARPDMHYLGQAGAYAKVAANARVYLHHPDGGKAYAISYPLQRFVGEIAPDNKPEIVNSGHLHQMSNFEVVGVDCYQPGCFEAQNTYLKRKGLHPALGGWVLEIQIEKGQVHVVSQTKIRWKNAIPKDF